MRKIFNFKSVRTKILFGFGVVIVLAVAIMSLAFLAFSDISEETEAIVEDQLPLIKAGEGVTLNMSESNALLRGYFIYKDDSIKETLRDALDEGEQLEKQYMKMTDDPEAKALFAQKEEWEGLVQKAIRDIDFGYQDSVSSLMSEMKPMSDEIMVGFKELSDREMAAIESAGEGVQSTLKDASFVILVIAIVVLLVSIIMAFITSRAITKPVKTVVERMSALAQGDLSQEPLTTRSRDEIAELVHATNTMNANNRELMQHIASVSETVSTQSKDLNQSAYEVKSGNEQIASTMEELSTGAETQANSAGELASVMNSFADKIEAAHQHGAQIEERSQSMTDLSGEGRDMMRASTEQMTRINDIVKNAAEKMHDLDQKSRQISTLVQVINDIADQTNLLALNAAIEAARAGEHGKGFAVVADEVRKLAEQVSHSAEDITGIVTDIQTESQSMTVSLNDGFSEVEQGTKQIESTGSTFEEIRSGLSGMVEAIHTISDHLDDIAGGGQQMNTAVEDIASVSEESAAGVEEAAASAQQASSSMDEVATSAQQLAHSAEELNGLLQRFKL
ncbi:Sensory rhodopsin II transducer [Lentibacillus sp. JNUCC-1]|uniref:methyl-accepting chemotaxis protein n=1 Tax=Lentibacillus sp. JNUCC-1 TaxID=2654513 RepID=UPI0012E91621|nr:methyl-accepting chemotaxis protein [Lentibacillus sp. JNUCC-1]MUV38630.1 Sensory rhodopsin II transducer [Lentibacillus sp. JNUCC-1]